MTKPDVLIRPATQADAETIKNMVHDERLNPFGLDWQNFLIAEVNGDVAGTGQIKPHKSCQELASLVTYADYRGQGVGSAMIAALEAKAGYPLYLMCRDEMASYYMRFGYETIPISEMPSYFKWIAIPMLIGRLFGERGHIMRKK